MVVLAIATPLLRRTGWTGTTRRRRSGARGRPEKLQQYLEEQQRRSPRGHGRPARRPLADSVDTDRCLPSSRPFPASSQSRHTSSSPTAAGARRSSSGSWTPVRGRRGRHAGAAREVTLVSGADLRRPNLRAGELRTRRRRRAVRLRLVHPLAEAARAGDFYGQRRLHGRDGGRNPDWQHGPERRGDRSLARAPANPRAT